MQEKSFIFTNDIRLCILYLIEHIGRGNPKLVSNHARLDVMEFIREYLDPKDTDNLVFLTLHFHKVHPDIRRANIRAREVYARLWRNLQGKGWHRKPMRAIFIVEHGKVGVLHMHTILNMGERTPKELRYALYFSFKRTQTSSHKVVYNFDYDEPGTLAGLELYDEKSFYKGGYRKKYIPQSFDHLLVAPVYDLVGLSDYLTKEYNWNLRSKQIDFGNLFTSETFFYPDK